MPTLPRRRPAATLVAVALCAAPSLFGTLPGLALDAQGKLTAERSQSDVSLRHEVQHAVERGQAWLLKQQDPTGFWSTQEHPAVTALVLMALTGSPGNADSPAMARDLSQGYAFLLGCAQPDGGIYRKELPSYNTSISLTALIGGNRPGFRPLIERARKYLIGLQNDSGGIGYGRPDKKPDLSNTAFALEAIRFSNNYLHTGESSHGREIGDLNWAAAVRFIQSCQNLPTAGSAAGAGPQSPDAGGFIYAPGISKAIQTNLISGRIALRSSGSMSYAGLMSYLYADLKREDPRVSAVVNWLADNYTLDENPALGLQGLYYYYHTMAKAMSVYGADSLKTADGRVLKWREQLALKLFNLQREDGSWANTEGRWWEKDPVLVTAYVVITLDLIESAL